MAKKKLKLDADMIEMLGELACNFEMYDAAISTGHFLRDYVHEEDMTDDQLTYLSKMSSKTVYQILLRQDVEEAMKLATEEIRDWATEELDRRKEKRLEEQREAEEEARKQNHLKAANLSTDQKKHLKAAGIHI